MIRFFSAAEARLICSRGFTLIELMVIIAIIGTLASIAIPNYISYRDHGVRAAVISEIKNIETVVYAFAASNDRFPDTLVEAGRGVPRDPWGNPFVYYPMDNVPPKMKIRKDRSLHPLNTDFELYSFGPDGKSKAPLTAKASRDDIIRANNGGYIGIAEYY